MVAVTHYGVDGEVVDSKIADVDDIKVQQGDNLVFFMTSQQVDNFRKIGDDVKINFEDGNSILVHGFLVNQRNDVESLLTFKDTLFTALEVATCFTAKGSLVIEPSDIKSIQKTSSDHVIRMDGSTPDGKTKAFVGTSFIYHFTLDEAFPLNSKIKVIYNQKDMPEWMQLEQIGPRKYVISGVPEKPDEGVNDIEIEVLAPDEEDENIFSDEPQDSDKIFDEPEILVEDDEFDDEI